MADLSPSAGGSGILKDFLVILIGAMVGALLVWIWDMTAGRLLSTSSFAGVLPGGGIVE